MKNVAFFIGSLQLWGPATKLSSFLPFLKARGDFIIKAMVLGSPVIATDCPSGSSELLDNGKYGILVPVENPDALADAIIKVLTDKELRQNMSRLSLERAQFFNIEKSLKQWEDIILGI